jgi:hypothetical protein
MYLVDLSTRLKKKVVGPMGLKRWVVRPMGSKRWIVRPVRNFLQVRELLVIYFLRDPR